jgi:acetyl-CoA acyltransferase
MTEPVIIEALRTPFGRRGGALREQRPDSLLAHAIDGLLDRAGVDPARIGDVIDGTVSQAGEQGANVGRLAVLLSRLPVTVPGVSLNRMCGSSQQAVHFAAQAVAAGDMDYAIGCGVESMTRTPMFLDINLGKAFTGFEALNPELFRRHDLIHQGESSMSSRGKATGAPPRRRRSSETASCCRRRAYPPRRNR